MSKCPTRRIPINTRSLTGECLGQEFESSLERDLLLLMAWEDDLDWFQVQPVQIHYVDPNGQKRRYTPDLYVHFKEISIAEKPVVKKPLLCEVKYREDLAKNWKVLKPKFKAARAYAMQHGWEFKIFTEDRIRTPRLNNIQFLWGSRSGHIDTFHRKQFIQSLVSGSHISINVLLDGVYPSSQKQERAEAVASLWCLLATKVILCDMSKPLAMSTIVWLAEPQNFYESSVVDEAAGST